MPTINVTNAGLSGQFTGSITYADEGGTTPPNPSTSALDDCIKQNTVGKSEAFPMGVPHDYSWYVGKSGATHSEPPPAGFTAMTWWAQVHCEENQPVVGGTMQVLHTEGWVRLKTGIWQKIQDQATISNGVEGGTYPADFQGAATGWNSSKQPDGSAQGPTPGANKCVHWWPTARGTYAANTVNGVWGRSDVKINGPAGMKFVINSGCDWWKDAGAPFLPDMSNNPGIGMSNWIKATASYRTAYYTDITEADLRANPPPPLKA
jgi:hypothetical protein